jgi:hypothetical protein
MTVYARRHNPRFRLTEPAYVTVGSEKSALVIDICVAGLRFKTSSPSQDSGSVRFRLTSGESEGTGDIVWLDDARTTGGVRFKTVPSEIRDQMSAWIEQSRRGAAEAPPKAPSVSTVDPHERESVAGVLESVAPVIEPRRAASTPTADHESKATESVNVAATVPAVGQGEKRTLRIFAAEPASTESKKDVVRESSTGRRFGVVVIWILVFFGAATVAAGHYYPTQAHDAFSRAQSIVERVVAFALERGLS